MNNNDSSTLNDLIKISKDGVKGFKKAAEVISNTNLKEILSDKALECQQAYQALQKHVLSQGEEPASSGSIMGAIHRGLMDVKLAVVGNDTYAILAECERGEDVAKAAYSKALQQDLSPEVRTLVEHQYHEVIKSHNIVRDLRDRYKDK